MTWWIWFINVYISSHCHSFFNFSKNDDKNALELPHVYLPLLGVPSYFAQFSNLKLTYLFPVLNWKISTASILNVHQFDVIGSWILTAYKLKLSSVISNSRSYPCKEIKSIGVLFKKDYANWKNYKGCGWNI